MGHIHFLFEVHKGIFIKFIKIKGNFQVPSPQSSQRLMSYSFLFFFIHVILILSALIS